MGTTLPSYVRIVLSLLPTEGRLGRSLKEGGRMIFLSGYGVERCLGSPWGVICYFFVSVFTVSVILLPGNFGVGQVRMLLLFVIVSYSVFTRSELSLFVNETGGCTTIRLSSCQGHLYMRCGVSGRLLSSCCEEYNDG